GTQGSGLPAYADLSLHLGLAAMTLLTSIATGVAFGVAPALSFDRVDGGRGTTEGRQFRQIRGLLVAGQIALSATLLAGAGLLARSVWQMLTAPMGFDSAEVLSVRLRLSTAGYPTLESRARFHERLLERLRA